MGTLMKILGERAMNPYMDGLDDIRKAKIKEFFETSEVKAKDKPPAPVPVPVAIQSKPMMKKKLPPKTGNGSAAAVKKIPPAIQVEEPPTPSKQSLPPRPVTKLSGLKLQKKPINNTNSNSPKKVPGEEPTAPTLPVSKFGLTGRGGLTGRTLQAPSISKSSEVSRELDNGLDTAEKAELEELRAGREKHATQLHEDKLERAKLIQEMNDLRMQVS